MKNGSVEAHVVQVPQPAVKIEGGTFCGGEIEPGTFHGPGVWVDDRADVNEPLARPVPEPVCA